MNDFASYIVNELGNEWILNVLGAKEFVIKEDYLEFRVPLEMTGGIIDKIVFVSVDNEHNVLITASNKKGVVVMSELVYDNGMITSFREVIEGWMCL